MRRWLPFINAAFLLAVSWFLLSFLAEPSATGRVRVALVVAAVVGIALALASAGLGVWMLVSRRT